MLWCCCTEYHRGERHRTAELLARTIIPAFFIGTLTVALHYASGLGVRTPLALHYASGLGVRTPLALHYASGLGVRAPLALHYASGLGVRTPLAAVALLAVFNSHL